MKIDKNKIIGLGLMVPAVVLALYIVFSIKMWIIGALAIIFTGLAMVGWNMFKGMAPKDAVNDVVDNVKKDVKDVTK